ncbi:MAG TPA: CPBP family intramembrane glutamic endopeptidase [Steroidobacteraceae bacterium]|jgi:membrane protease YdiL (CAAX protease family)|nr:CPBP family intramembrane glutamic endopeptidase [Steroidobacteraceae bacterium]
MRAFAIFMGLIALGLGGIAFLGYPAWLLISPLLDHPKFHRVASRVGMLLLVVGFVVVARKLKVADRRSLGFGLPAPRFVAEVGKAVFFGALLMMPALITMIAFDMRQRVGAPLDVEHWVRLALSGIVTGLTVALIEETFLRGAMQTAITRESGARLAILLTSLVYAITHFIGRYRVPAADVNAGSGFDMLAHALGVLGHPLHILDAFVCLTAVGCLLGLVRARTGNIAASIGLHAGWVAMIYVVRETSERRSGAPGAWLLSEYDGFIGWLVLAWTLAIGGALICWYRDKEEVVPGRGSRGSVRV